MGLAQLSFDVVVALLPAILHKVIPTSATLDALPWMLSLVLVLCIQTTVSYFVGAGLAPYTRMLESESVIESGGQFISFYGRACLYVLVSFIVLLMLWFWLPSRLGVIGLASVIFGSIVLIGGAVLGFLNTSSEKPGERTDTVETENPNQSGPSDSAARRKETLASRALTTFRTDDQVSPAAVIPAIAFFATLFGVIAAFSGIRGIISLLVFLLAVVCALVAGSIVALAVGAFLRVWQSWVARLPVLQKVASQAIFPAIVAAGLILWEHINLVTGAAFTTAGLSSADSVKALLITGVIPLRVVVLFTPPFKWMNALSAVLAVILSVTLTG